MESIEHYYIDTSVLLENAPHIKFIRNHIRDSGGVFCISSLVKISITSLISCIIETSLDLPRKSSAIFGNLLKFFEKHSCGLRTILEILWKSSESGGKSSEKRQKLRYQYVYIIKRIIHGCL